MAYDRCHGVCVDLHQRDAVLGFADYHVDVYLDIGKHLPSAPRRKEDSLHIRHRT